MKTIISFLLVFLPFRIKRFILNSFYCAEIDKTAKIGFSYLKCDKIIMKKHSRIGHLNIVKNLSLLHLDEYSGFGHLNNISAVSTRDKKLFQNNPERSAHLIMGKHSSITARHYLDCCGGINIGAFTIIAGLGTSIFTHGINLKDNKQETAEVTLGKYCMIGTNSVLLKGSRLPDYCVLGAASVLQKNYSEDYTLYSGVPAVPVKKFDEDYKFFKRKDGFVR